jgi:hypothetical protein
MYQRRNAVAVLGVLALTGTVVLAGCGGSTSATTPAASAPAESAPATSMPAGGTDGFDPPRPTGIPDEGWADLTAQLDPAGTRARFEAKTPEEQAKQCQEPYPVPAEVLAAAAADSAEQVAGSTVEEWTALFDYKVAADEAYGMAELRAELCASLPPVTAPKGSGASDDYSDDDDSDAAPE